MPSLSETFELWIKQQIDVGLRDIISRIERLEEIAAQKGVQVVQEASGLSTRLSQLEVRLADVENTALDRDEVREMVEDDLRNRVESILDDTDVLRERCREYLDSELDDLCITVSRG